MIRVALAIVCGLSAVAAAATERFALEVGFDGAYRTGSWTPVRVVFPRDSRPPEAVCVWAEDPDGQYVRSPAAAVEALDDGRAVARLAVRFGRPSGRLLVEPTSASGGGGPADPATLEQVSLPQPLPSTDTVFLVLGDLPAAERASRLLSRDDGTRPRIVVLGGHAQTGGRAAAVPAAAAGRDFDGIDAIIASGRAVAAADSRVLAGIDDWVRQGGQLVLLAGPTAADIGRAANGAAKWLPGAVSKLVPLRRGNAIETYARASRPLDKAAFSSLQVPLFDQPQAIDGSVEAFEGRGPADVPLVVRRAYGLGRIVWAGIDLDEPPFENWSGSDSLLVEMLRGRRAARDAGRTGETARGSLDLAGQLRQAIDRFSGVAPIPFEVIAGLGMLYVACLYPLDWWLVSGRRRGGPPGRRAWLAWLSLPLVVAAASGVAWSAGERWKGRSWRSSAAEIVDLDLSSGLLRTAAFIGLWSPQNASVGLRASLAGALLPPAGAAPSAAAPATAVSWFAASGRGIGGTDATAAHPSLAARDYGYDGTLETLSAIPVAASSSRLFEAEIVSQAASTAVDSTLGREGQGTLRGAVTNRLPFPLEDCALVHAGWLYDVGTLSPGQTFQPGASRGPRSLSGALTRRTMQKDREVAARWDLAERDPLRILEIAGFHAAAGGSGYTSLEAGRLARFDLSPLLPLDRAVLVGRGPTALAWHCRRDEVGGGEVAAPLPPFPHRTSLWRIVIPLPKEAAPPATSAPERPLPSPGIP